MNHQPPDSEPPEDPEDPPEPPDSEPPEDPEDPPEPPDSEPPDVTDPEDSFLSLNDLFARLTSAYGADALRASADWELPALRETLAALEPELLPRYRFCAALPPGGGGVPIILADMGLNGQRAVLKLPRPVQGREGELNNLLAKEARRLSDARHPNVIRILAAGTIPSNRIPYYVMEYIDNAKDADKYVAEQATIECLLPILATAMAALTHIHGLGLVHTDVKPSNIFVDDKGRAVLADFGFAKRVLDPGVTVGIGGTAGYMHPDQVALLRSVSTSKRDDAEVNRQATTAAIDLSLIQPAWDLYSFGVTMLVLLRAIARHDPRVGLTYPMRYLRLLAHRLIGPNLEYARVNTRVISPDLGIGRTVLGLSEADLAELSYPGASEAYADLAKLLGTRDLIREVPEIGRYQHDVIQASSQGPVAFTERVRRIIQAREVRQLGTVNQLGLVALVYPTATHSRLEHTLGTFGTACRYVRALYADPINPLFRQVMTSDDIEALLVASLVHDVGHYPLAHDLEEVHPGIFGHEARTEHILRSDTTEVARLLREETQGGWAVTVDRVSSILGASGGTATFRDRVLGSVIDGPIDADKLDYLLRDSENLRVAYGKGVDDDRLVQNLTVVMAPEPGRGPVGTQGLAVPSIGIHERGRIAAESLAFARYSLYGSVYWHRTHRTLKAMLNQVAYEALDAFYEARTSSRNYGTDFRKALYELLDEPMSPTLPFVQDDADIEANSAFLDAGEIRILRWLGAHAPSRTAGLMTDIMRRRLYKRVLVVSRARDSGVPWATLDSTFSLRSAANHTKAWQARVAVARMIQNGVAEAVATWDGKVAEGRSAVDVGVAQEFADESTRRPIILFDYPTQHISRGLKCLREAEWTDVVDDGFVAVAAEESPIWAVLVSKMHQSLAKMRVYCDPDYAGLVTAVLGRDQLRAIVVGAITEIANE